MPRPPATDATHDRVARLSRELLGSIEKRGDLAALAERARLCPETVRELLKAPEATARLKRRRYGPGFFIVSALARAQNLSLDELVARVDPDDEQA